MQLIRVLVTGAGSMVGQGIIKSLQISSLPLTIIAADISPFHAGLYRAHEGVVIPRVESDEAYDDMVRILNQNQIHVVMIGSEFDLEFFSRYKQDLERDTSALIIVSNIETVRMANDKWLMVQFLKERNLPYPESFIPSNLEEAILFAEQLTYPLILKPRQGTSARNVHFIKDKQELISLFSTVSRPLLQKLINKPQDGLGCEYTCSLFKTKNNQIIGPFNSRRMLKNGSSWVTEVKAFHFLNPLLMEIGKNIDFMGSINIQLMDSKEGPIPFEFNPRSSGTTAIRSYFGFNEPKMSIQSFYLNEKIDIPIIRYGHCLRYVEEIFLPEGSIEDNPLKTTSQKMDWF